MGVEVFCLFGPRLLSAKGLAELFGGTLVAPTLVGVVAPVLGFLDMAAVCVLGLFEGTAEVLGLFDGPVESGLGRDTAAVDFTRCTTGL